MAAQIARISADDILLNTLATLIHVYSGQPSRLQRNRDDHTRSDVRATPLACTREKLRADLEIRMLHCSTRYDLLRSAAEGAALAGEKRWRPISQDGSDYQT